jgi:hypothetical protein
MTTNPAAFTFVAEGFDRVLARRLLTTPGSEAMNRKRPSNGRQHESFTFTHAGMRDTAGIGRFEDGRIAEVFLNGAKCGNDADTAAKDAAIVASLVLQHGVPRDVISRSLTRDRNGSAIGPICAVLDVVAALPCPAASDRSTSLPVEEGAP